MSNRIRMRVPATAKRGEIIEIRTLIEHLNESGWRRDDDGKAYPRKIIHTFTCTYNGVEVFRGALKRAVSVNPYFVFHTRAVASGELVLRWEDEGGAVFTATAKIAVE